MFGMSLWSFLNSSPCMAHKMHERCRKKSKSLNPINFFHLPENFRTCRFGVVVFFVLIVTAVDAAVVTTTIEEDK